MKAWTVPVALVAVVVAGAVTARAQDDGNREVQLPVVSQPVLPAPPADTPRLDVAVSCEAAAAVAVSAGRDKEACLSDEQEAKVQLDKDWPAAVRADNDKHKTRKPANKAGSEDEYEGADTSLCFGNVKTGGPPSYVELLSCLNVRKDFGQIKQTDPLMTAEVPQPLPPALPHHYRECREPVAPWCVHPSGRLWVGDADTLARQNRGGRRAHRHAANAG